MAIFSHERCFNSLLSLHSDSTHFVTLCGSILCLFCKIKPVRTLDVDFIIQWCMDITRSLTIGPKAQARKFPLFLSPDSSPQCLIRVGTLLFFHSGAIYHVHRKHGALTRNLSTNTATADNSKHISDPKTLSFTRNDPLRTSVPSRGWGARSRVLRPDSDHGKTRVAMSFWNTLNNPKTRGALKSN